MTNITKKIDQMMDEVKKSNEKIDNFSELLKNLELTRLDCI